MLSCYHDDLLHPDPAASLHEVKITFNLLLVLILYTFSMTKCQNTMFRSEHVEQAVVMYSGEGAYKTHPHALKIRKIKNEWYR